MTRSRVGVGRERKRRADQQQYTDGGSLPIPAPPEIKKVEPVIRIAADILLQQRRIPFDSRLHGGLALSRLNSRKVRERFERDVIAIPAAIQADHEK